MNTCTKTFAKGYYYLLRRFLQAGGLTVARKLVWTRINDQLYDDITKIANIRKTTVSEIIRELICEYIDNEKKHNPQFFEHEKLNTCDIHELIKHLLRIKCNITNQELWVDAEDKNIWYFMGRRGKNEVYGQVKQSEKFIEVLWCDIKVLGQNTKPQHWWVFYKDTLILYEKKGTKDR